MSNSTTTSGISHDAGKREITCVVGPETEVVQRSADDSAETGSRVASGTIVKVGLLPEDAAIHDLEMGNGFTRMERVLKVDRFPSGPEQGEPSFVDMDNVGGKAEQVRFTELDMGPFC